MALRCSALPSATDDPSADTGQARPEPAEPGGHKVKGYSCLLMDVDGAVVYYELLSIEGFHRRHVGSNPDARPRWRHSM